MATKEYSCSYCDENIHGILHICQRNFIGQYEIQINVYKAWQNQSAVHFRDMLHD